MRYALMKHTQHIILLHKFTIYLYHFRNVLRNTLNGLNLGLMCTLPKETFFSTSFLIQLSPNESFKVNHFMARCYKSYASDNVMWHSIILTHTW